MRLQLRPGIIRWIAKLSGPGGFTGFGYEFFPLCYGKKNGVTRLGTVTSEVSDSRAFAADLNCRGFHRDGRLLMGGFQVAHLKGANNLQYDDSVPRSFTEYGRSDSRHGAQSIPASATGPSTPGRGAGFVRYLRHASVPFNHPIYHLRLTIKPLALERKPALVPPSDPAYRAAVLDRYKEDALQVRLEMNMMPGGLDDADPLAQSRERFRGPRRRLPCAGRLPSTWATSSSGRDTDKFEVGSEKSEATNLSF